MARMGSAPVLPTIYLPLFVPGQEQRQHQVLGASWYWVTWDLILRTSLLCDHYPDVRKRSVVRAVGGGVVLHDLYYPRYYQRTVDCAPVG